jgi:hypothetical protein
MLQLFLFVGFIITLMPNLIENLCYFFNQHLRPYKKAAIKLAKNVAILVAVAFLLEVFVFNFNYFRSAGYSTINLKNQIELSTNQNEQFKLTSVNHVIEFSDLNTEVKNIMLNFDNSQTAQDFTVKVQFTDEAHLTYFDSTEYTVGIPETTVSTKSWESMYINLNTAGKVSNLRIEITGDDVSYPIYLNTIYLNAHHPFNFVKLRFALTFFIMLMVYMFRPNSAIYRLSIVENPRKCKAAIILCNGVEILLVSALLFFGSNLVGVASSSYNYGEWDGVSLINTYEAGGDNAQQYAHLARAMAKGQLYLDDEPPQWLQDMDTPYDKGARDQAQKETGEDYLFDVAYYDGHYYVYFGVVPVLLFYLPFYLITGCDFPTAIGVLIAIVMFVLGCSALLHRFAYYHFKRVNLGIYLLLQICLVSCCGILYLIKFPTFYSLPIACGLAFSVWGLYFWMRGRAPGHKCANYVAGSLCMALVAGCRPQLLLLSFLAFPLFWRAYISKRRICTKEGICEFICLIAPYLIVAAGIMLYNHARFGSFTDFGANYNLTVNDMTKRGWNIGRLAPAFFSYFLQPPNIVGVFPFIQAADFSTTYMGQTIKEVTFGGIFACLPILWVLLFVRPVVRLRNSQRSSRTISGVIITLLISGVVIALVDAEMAGILQRYYADFSFMFLAAAVLVIFVINENLLDVKAQQLATFKHPLEPGSPQFTRSAMTKVLMVLVAVSLAYSLLICFVPETGWYSDIYSWAYQNLIETFLFWT